MIETQKPTLLAVDDEPTNLKVLNQVLGNDYRLIFAKSGPQALELAHSKQPALILLDVMMPDMSGFEVCEQLKQRPSTQAIPVIFVTAMQDEVDETQGFAKGAVDYITKPISPAIVKARVKNHLSLVQADLLKAAQLELIQRLSHAAEYKDNETGQHIIRMSRYCHIIARAYGFNEAHAESLLLAAPMHDIGKIGIPDNILLKPGRLDQDEYRQMQTHASIGADILAGSSSALIQLAHRLALEHHERFDGNGYPNGLQGEEISIEGRICAIADVFDALTSKRPYKEPWPIDKAVQLLQEEKGKHFDPELVDIFMACLDDILAVKAQYPS
ncbi:MULTISPECIES: response regulator [Pseudoalteromonas]|uniref:Chemotaxis protein CheY n=1 Tax=Pseudoalteromonas ruthenica TaxID=151081 RepID=A0A0F4Q2C3_9GAMM|nr:MULTISPECIES: two-component system response regulator [Pseudoalteromonas]KJZ00707.1 chemotaxis protein CheY [Pseudoalteromonas ruthenica]KJZ01239.1 chemotaxis protein CheY [Pseudoalteromonas ruthenica]MCG7571196.1 two-component system response regulator [Pseudoalteromonas sp. CNC9-20]QFU04495.1 Cyclic di-GMP phosphodiesterase response regulator RpfG [Pseudoalteromonas sp. THAF3]RZF79962.1 two-component system response regulator [Pseudoalteromonas sp. CO325X]